tara:strand:- start:313 stop:1200 length:888 start_codon:yes stop_codon:yes gene_type:complete
MYAEGKFTKMRLISKIKSTAFSLFQHYQTKKQKFDLSNVNNLFFDFQNLKYADEIDVVEIFNSPKITKIWEYERNAVEKFGIPDGTGGVNPGDRRALFYLIAAFKPKSVLEIGTHIGASTVNLAAALSAVHSKDIPKLVSVDLRSVNCTKSKPWLKFGSRVSPEEMIKSLGLKIDVEFITSSSFQYASNTKERFDFIFLDGDHSAKNIYQEIHHVLPLLKPNSVLVMHDYSPDGKSLWLDRKLMSGPFLAVDRIKSEEASLMVAALGELPWPTKKGSNATSLALFLASKKEQTLK